MQNLSLRKYVTIASVCAIVIVLSLAVFFSSVAYGQETPDQNLPATDTAQEVRTAPSNVNYAIEELNAVNDIVVGDFVVGPGKTELTIEPGKSKIVEVVLSNRTGEEREFELIVEDARGSMDPSVPIVLLGDDRGPYTLKDYIRLPYTTITLGHNQRARIPVTVAVPADAEPGGRYGSVLVTTVSKKADTGEITGAAPSSAIISRVGTLFFLTIPGDTKVEGKLQGFATVPDKNFFTDGPINFQILYENTGDLHLGPYGEIRITNILGEEVGFVELDPWFALPKSLRSREITWSREMLIGRYTATAYINRGYDDIIDTKEVTFWVLPWRVVLPVFIGLFLLFFSIRFVVRNFEFKRKSN